MSFKRIHKKEQRYLRAKWELQSGNDKCTGKPLTDRQKRKRYGIIHKWWKNIRTVHYGYLGGAKCR